MPPPINLATHQAQLELWQQALESTKGIRARCESQAAAKSLQLRLQYARAAARREAVKQFPIEHPQHGKSYFEELTTKLGSDEKGWYVMIFKEEDLTVQVEEM